MLLINIMVALNWYLERGVGLGGTLERVRLLRFGVAHLEDVGLVALPEHGVEVYLESLLELLDVEDPHNLY